MKAIQTERKQMFITGISLVLAVQIWAQGVLPKLPDMPSPSNIQEDVTKGNESKGSTQRSGVSVLPELPQQANASSDTVYGAESDTDIPKAPESAGNHTSGQEAAMAKQDATGVHQEERTGDVSETARTQDMAAKAEPVVLDLAPDGVHVTGTVVTDRHTIKQEVPNADARRGQGGVEIIVRQVGQDRVLRIESQSFGRVYVLGHDVRLYGPNAWIQFEYAGGGAEGLKISKQSAEITGGVTAAGLSGAETRFFNPLPSSDIRIADEATRPKGTIAATKALDKKIPCLEFTADGTIVVREGLTGSKIIKQIREEGTVSTEEGEIHISVGQTETGRSLEIRAAKGGRFAMLGNILDLGAGGLVVCRAPTSEDIRRGAPTNDLVVRRVMSAIEEGPEFDAEAAAKFFFTHAGGVIPEPVTEGLQVDVVATDEQNPLFGQAEPVEVHEVTPSMLSGIPGPDKAVITLPELPPPPKIATTESRKKIEGEQGAQKEAAPSEKSADKESKPSEWETKVAQTTKPAGMPTKRTARAIDQETITRIREAERAVIKMLGLERSLSSVKKTQDTKTDKAKESGDIIKPGSQITVQVEGLMDKPFMKKVFVDANGTVPISVTAGGEPLALAGMKPEQAEQMIKKQLAANGYSGTKVVVRVTELADQSRVSNIE